MGADINGEQLRKRSESYFVEHYAALHNTVASVVLAVAGAAAASLAGSHAQYGRSYPLLWMFWLASFLVCATVFAGTMSGNLAAPSRMPAIADLVLPLLLGVGESVLFGVLAHQVTGVTEPSSVAEDWFICLAFVCACAAAAITRAMQFFAAANSDSSEIPPPIKTYLSKRLPADRKGALGISVIGIGGAVASAVELTMFEYVLAGCVIAGLLFALRGHSKSAALLQTAVEQAGGEDTPQPQADIGDPSGESGRGHESADPAGRRPRRRALLIALAVMAAVCLRRGI